MLLSKTLRTLGLFLATSTFLAVDSFASIKGEIVGVYELKLESLLPAIPEEPDSEHVVYLVVHDREHFTLIDGIDTSGDVITAKTTCEGEYEFDGDLFEGTIVCPTRFKKIGRQYRYDINLTNITERKLRLGTSVKVKSDLFTFSSDRRVSFTMRRVPEVP